MEASASGIAGARQSHRVTPKGRSFTAPLDAPFYITIIIDLKVAL
ncbi:hypothetical protein [Sphingomonas lacusdianchii]|nr:hypothetical protein [Sphingomonas sp. JXJ CY 53]